MNNKIEIKNGQITIEILQELTKVLHVPFNHLMVNLSNGQLNPLNYFFITDLKNESIGQTKMLTLEKNKYGISIHSYGYCGITGESTNFLTSYQLFTIKPL